MPLYEIAVSGARFATIVVRASDESRAAVLGATAAAEYTGPDGVGEVTVHPLDPEGPEAVLIEDWN